MNKAMHRLSAILLIALCCLSTPLYSADPTKKKRTPPPHRVETHLAQYGLVSTQHERSGDLKVRRQVRVFNQEEGRITQLPHYEGDSVQAGEILLRMDDALLLAELDKARATRKQAELDLERIAKLRKRRLSSDDEKARAQTAVEVARAEEAVLTTRLGNTRIKAPFAGIISERLAEPGDVLARYSHALTLIDPNTLITEIAVSELLLPLLKRGDAVEIRIDALAGKVFSGSIQRIHPSLDPLTRHGRVEIRLEPVPAGAMAGQFCRVSFTTNIPQALAIPLRALKRDRQGEYVYIVDQDNKAQRQSVRSGLKLGESVLITEGLKGGENLVIRGFLGLRPGKAVETVMETS